MIVVTKASSVTGEAAGALPDPGEWGQEGIDLHPVEDHALHLAAEEDQQGSADQGDRGEQDERHGDAALVEEIAVARHAVGGLEAFDEALDDAGRRPQGDDAGADQETWQGRSPMTRNCWTTRSSVPGGTIWLRNLSRVAATNSARVWTRMVGGTGEHREEAEHGRVGGGLGVAEAAVVQGGEEGLAEQPRKGPESHRHYGQYSEGPREEERLLRRGVPLELLIAGT